MKVEQTVIVTGGSRGIGKAIVLEAASSGYHVCFSYLSNEQAAYEVCEQARKHGIHASAIQADVSQEEAVHRLFKGAEEFKRPVKALINNAGISGDRKKLEDTAPYEWESIFKVNVFGTFLCSREALKKLERGGIILNISSQAAAFGGNKLTPYAASKAAISAFTIGLAREAADKGIRVNALSPGIIATDQNSFSDAEEKQAIIKSIPLGRLGTPEDVAKAALWLISDESSFISGAIIPIAGGR